MLFDSQNTNLKLLKERAYNLRWAEVKNGIIPLTAADLDFPCDPQISEAIQAYAKEGYFNYGPALGLPILKENLSRFFYQKRNVSISPDHVLPVDSAAFGIYLVCKSFLQPGDEAVILDPVDFLFRYSVEAIGAKAIPFSIPPGKTDVDFQALEALISPKTKMICLCNPLNPTGKVFTKNELISLATFAHQHQLIILSDEIWSDIIFDDASFTSIASIDEEISNQTIIVTGFSKSYGLAGLRIGAVLTKNSAFFDQIVLHSLHQSTIHGINSLSQVAAATALEKSENWLKEFLQHLHKMRLLCVDALNNIDGFSCIAPEGCYVAFADISKTGMSSKEMHSFLLEKAKVAVVPGLKEWFGEGAEGYIRISFATSELILKEAFEKINTAIKQYQPVSLSLIQ